MPKSAYSDIAVRLRAARHEREWTIEQLSTQSGVSARSIVEFESGRALPRLDTLGKLADALGHPVVDFLAEAS